MTDKTVTATLTDDEAREVLCALNGKERQPETVTAAAEKISAALPPEWKEGAVAWITRTDSDKDRRRLCVYNTEKGWTYGGTDALLYQHRVTKVEPLRVLGDDEIAVKRHMTSDAKWHRKRATDLAHDGFDASAQLHHLHAEALEKAGR